MELNECISNDPPPVYIVDDDSGFRKSITSLTRVMGFRPRPFSDPDDLLDDLGFIAPGIFLIDIRMPQRSGLNLLQEIRDRGCHWPAAIITGHGEIPLAVRAMKLGAIEFLEKPFSDRALEEVLQTGTKKLPAGVERSRQFKSIERFENALSTRQKEVFEGVVSGLTSKEIGQRLGLSNRTIEAYRLEMMKKLEMDSLAELMELKLLLREKTSEN